MTDIKSQDAADIGEAVVLQILRVADLMTRIGDSKVFGKELTQPQFNILMILKRNGQDSMSQKEIMSFLVSTKGNVSIHITNLARMGYIQKKASKIDSRMHAITLTTKGRRILEELEPRYIQHLNDITNDLPVGNTKAAMELLEHLQQKCEIALNGASAVEKGGNAA